jgi:hypothetical protein
MRDVETSGYITRYLANYFDRLFFSREMFPHTVIHF